MARTGLFYLGSVDVTTPQPFLNLNLSHQLWLGKDKYNCSQIHYVWVDRDKAYRKTRCLLKNEKKYAPIVMGLLEKRDETSLRRAALSSGGANPLFCLGSVDVTTPQPFLNLTLSDQLRLGKDKYYCPQIHYVRVDLLVRIAELVWGLSKKRYVCWKTRRSMFRSWWGLSENEMSAEKREDVCTVPSLGQCTVRLYQSS